MDTSSLNHCEVESCLKWKTSLPLERPHKSKAFWCQGIQRHFKFTINPQKFLYFLYLVSNHGDFKPFEATVNIEVLKKSIRIDKVYVRSASQNISCFHLDDVDPMSLSNCTSVTIAFLCPGDVDLKLFQNPSGPCRGACLNLESLETFSNHMGRLQVDESFQNISLECEGELFLANKHILIVRSRRFEYMLQGWNFLSREYTTMIRIDDLDKGTLEEVLGYLYRGKLRDEISLTVNSARCLYDAAKKYDIDCLARRCRDVLVKSLTTGNVYEMLLLAHSWCDCEFKDSVFKYAFEQEVLLQEQWTRTFRYQYSDLAMEVYHAFYLAHCD